MISNPGFTANALDEKWDEFISDPSLPLINRASQGAYAPPEILLPYLSNFVSILNADSPSPTPIPGLQPVKDQNFQVSPEEIARIAAAFSNGGTLLPATMALAVDTPLAGWILIPHDDQTESNILNEQAISSILGSYKIDGTNFWGTVSAVPNGRDQTVTWFVGGTLPETQAQTGRQPLAIALLLEQDNPALARELGLKMLERASQQTSDG